MKLVVSGDKHIGLVSDGVSRLEEQERILDFVVDQCKGAEVHVDLGDLFDVARPSPEAYTLGMKYFLDLADADCENFVLAGNHDKPTRADWNALDPLAVARGLGTPPIYSPGSCFTPCVVSMPASVEVEDWRFVFLPFVTEFEAKKAGSASAQALLNDFVAALPDGAKTVSFVHLDVEGSKRNEFDSRQRDVGLHIPPRLIEISERVYAGHVHRPQSLEGVTIVGSSIHVDFGESSDEKGLVIVELS